MTYARFSDPMAGFKGPSCGSEIGSAFTNTQGTLYRENSSRYLVLVRMSCGFASAIRNSRRDSGCDGSTGTYAPPAIHTARTLRIASTDRSIAIATSFSGPMLDGLSV